MFSNRLWLILMVAFAIICPLASAGDFTNVINSSSIDTYYNVTYVQMPVSTVPLEDVIWLASVGIILLVLSLILRCDQCNDIIAIMSVFPLGVASWRFQTIDIITSGVAGVFDSSKPAGSQAIFVQMTQHNSVSLYHEGIMCLIFFLIALFNVYRIILMNREIAAIKGRQSNYEEEE